MPNMPNISYWFTRIVKVGGKIIKQGAILIPEGVKPRSRMTETERTSPNELRPLRFAGA
jgi:hypothetical protein